MDGMEGGSKICNGKNIREDDALGEVVTGLERHCDCVCFED
jgi:hypothetical protein